MVESEAPPLGLAMDVRHEVLFIGAEPLSPIALELPMVSENERISPKLVQALGDKTEFDVTNQPISDVAAFLTDLHGITIRLGWPGLEQPELVGVRPVTRSVKGISLKSALELILSELDLSCVADGEQLVIVPRRPGVRPLPQRWEILYSDITLDGYAKHLDEQSIELGLVDAGKVTYVSGFSKPKPDVREGESSDEKRLWLRWQKGEMKQADEELLRRTGVAAGDHPILQFYPDALEKRLLSLERDYRGRDIAAIAKTRFAIRKRGPEFEFYVIDQEERAERK